MVYKESLYQLLYFCTNPVLGQNLVPELQAKILLTNQIAGFLNQLFLLKKMMKPDFLYANTDSVKLKVNQKILGWVWLKMGVTTLVSAL